MRIYFINPPVSNTTKQIREGRCMLNAGAWSSLWSPVSLALCAAKVRTNKEMEVKLIDCVAERINFPKLSAMVKDFYPDLVVINTSTPSIESDLRTIKYVKDVNRKIRTAIIGIHGSVLTKDCFYLSADLDFIIRGEPEYTVYDLTLAINDNKDLSLVRGISYRKEGKIIHNPSRGFIKDLDKLPYPAWDLVDLSKYTLPFSDKQFLLIIPARGCPHKCGFCNSKIYYGSSLRLRAVKNVVDELEWAKDKLGIDNFLFWTESFTLDKKYALGITEEILRRKLKISWVCNSRVDDVDKKMLDRFKKAGCWMIGYGIESGDNDILKRTGKGINVNQSINAVSLAKKSGLQVVAYYVLGLPGETKKSIKKTIKLANRLDTDFAQFYCAVPYPGCGLYEEAKEKKWLNSNEWRKFEQNYSILDMESITAKEVMFFRKTAYLRFYFHPRRMYRILKRIKSKRTFLNFIRMVKDFLSWINKN
ncbi:radical SAM protein [bacterium]|nr:radical SAM protein [bacterium]